MVSTLYYIEKTYIYESNTTFGTCLGCYIKIKKTKSGHKQPSFQDYNRLSQLKKHNTLQISFLWGIKL